jgi:hypothetical protein
MLFVSFLREAFCGAWIGTRHRRPFLFAGASVCYRIPARILLQGDAGFFMESSHAVHFNADRIGYRIARENHAFGVESGWSRPYSLRQARYVELGRDIARWAWEHHQNTGKRLKLLDVGTHNGVLRKSSKYARAASTCGLKRRIPIATGRISSTGMPIGTGITVSILRLAWRP